MEREGWECGVFGGWGRWVDNGRFWHAFGVETPRADVSTCGGCLWLVKE